MKDFFIDVSVLLIFFNRPDNFEKVFSQVKKARPARLFLYQDGPRNDKDKNGIAECREIALDVDWDCEIHTFFQEKNKGCDPSEYIAQKWAFSLTDKCIILEDDDIPTISFFKFCKELLDKYENDERIWMISGFNHEETFNEVKEDYFFTSFFSIWGWATWKRVIDKWDTEYKFLEREEEVERIKNLIKQKKLRSDFIEFCKTHKESGKEHYETISWSGMILNSGLAIMPTKNMINNIGVSSDSTHFSSSVDMLPKGYRKIFTMKRYELEGELIHPKEVQENIKYRENVYKTLAWDHPWIKVGRSFEELYLNLKYGNFSNVRKSIIKRLKKIMGR